MLQHDPCIDAGLPSSLLLSALHCLPVVWYVQAETFQNTTVIIVLDIAHHPRDEPVVDKVCV